MRLVFTPRAIRELRDIGDYIARRDPTAAASVLSRVAEFAHILAEHPHVGRPSGHRGARIISVPRLPYLIIFRTRLDDVEVLNIRNGRRRPSRS